MTVLQDGLPLEWPGVPGQLDMVNDREQIRAMELITYGCSSKFHAAHPIERDGQTVNCPGLTSEPCVSRVAHTHHRWATGDAFYWCNGVQR